MGLIDLYSSLIANMISAGTLIKKDDLDSFSIRPAYNKILTRNAVSQVWMISGLPVRYSSNISHVIRAYVKEHFPEIRVRIHFHSTKVNVNTKSKPYIRRRENAIQYYEDYRQTLESLGDARQKTGKRFKAGTRSIEITPAGLIKAEDEMDSYIYISTAKAESKGIFETRMFVVARTKEISDLNRFSPIFTDFLKEHAAQVYPIYGDMNNYMTNFGPSTLDNGNLKKFYPFLTTDENLSALAPTMTRGLFGNGKGVMFGLDIMSKYPVHVDMFNTSTAQVILVCAMAGFGKTAFVQMLTPNILIERAHASVVDMKGDEWEKIFPIVGNSYEKIDMDLGLWVNTMRIDDLPVSEGEEEEVYNSAISSTVRLFLKALQISPNEGNVKDVIAFLKEAIEKCYDTLSGFDANDRTTFHLTNQLAPYKVLTFLQGLNSTSLEPQQRSLLNIMVRRAALEISEDKMPPHKEITLSRILDTKYVVYAMNMVKGDISIGRESMRLMMIAYLNKKKHFYRKKKGLHTVEIYEETQISDAISDDSFNLIDLMSESVTVGRSENVSVILLTNSIGILTKENMRSIASNISGLVIGKVIDQDIEVLKGLNGGNVIEGYVRHITANENGNLDNCFAVRMNSGGTFYHTITRAIIPDDIEQMIRQRDMNG